MLESIPFIGSIIGTFAILDALVDEKIKHKVSEFIFGFHNIKTQAYELSIIRSVVSIFLKNNTISIWRILIYSVFSFLISGILFIPLISSLFPAGESSTFFELVQSIFIDEARLEFPWVFAAMSLLIFCLFGGFISDYWNLYITHQVFFRLQITHNQPNLTTFIFVLDFIISLLPAYLFIIHFYLIFHTSFGGFQFENTDDVSLKDIFNIASIFTLAFATCSTLFTFFVKLLLFFIGITLRATLILTKLNSYTVLYTRVHEYPFSFLGIIFIVCYNLYKLLN